eukprot:Protomagalhaensia_wolfi_Nauph_80__3189@NODE_3248_length_845_cov_5_086849_g2542_i0_p1_GENE_NODE_3248_length_845_cov_5_086849_g2542_i0NODE_3248_length_845_cov_5_086849_g2542_i0_p1_ORF_typecomplete_len161_score24_92_NODE_3248_length_845_cov_5_086849_g2542_i0172654
MTLGHLAFILCLCSAQQAQTRHLRKPPTQVPIPETMFPPPDRLILPPPFPLKSRPAGYWDKGMYGGTFGSYITGFAGLPPTAPLMSPRDRGFDAIYPYMVPYTNFARAPKPFPVADTTTRAMAQIDVEAGFGVYPAVYGMPVWSGAIARSDPIRSLQSSV